MARSGTATIVTDGASADHDHVVEHLTWPAVFGENANPLSGWSLCAADTYWGPQGAVAVVLAALAGAGRDEPGLSESPRRLARTTGMDLDRHGSRLRRGAQVLYSWCQPSRNSSVLVFLRHVIP
jgi:hypothetical protein